jgi:RNA polymerase sigma-70 factor (ECF subfamily)
VHGLLSIFAAVTASPGRVGDDGAVLERIARGEDPALAELYDRYAQVLYTLGMRILRSVQESEDIVQEVFIQVWKKADSYDAQKGTVYTWLVTMMRNRAIDRLRSKGYKHAAQHVDPSVVVLFADAPSSNPHSHAVRSENQNVVLGTLKQLSVDQQQVLALAYYEGFSQSEIAKKLNIPLGTVKSRMRHALQSMRSKLKGKM